MSSNFLISDQTIERSKMQNEQSDKLMSQNRRWSRERRRWSVTLETAPGQDRLNLPHHEQIFLFCNKYFFRAKDTLNTLNIDMQKWMKVNINMKHDDRTKISHCNLQLWQTYLQGFHSFIKSAFCEHNGKYFWGPSDIFSACTFLLYIFLLSPYSICTLLSSP